jgi:molecular chaperone GrpE
MATNEPQAPMANADAETEQMRETEQKPEEPRTETLPGAEELLRQAELKAQEHHDAWLRAKAETENVRKRAQIEVANAHKYAIENFALELLPVKDSLEAALAAGTATADAIRSGVEITLKQLNAVFEKANLREINPVGQKFDPHQHQAISMLPSDREPNTVINVLQKGYTLNDRVIRPALVTVSQSR